MAWEEVWALFRTCLVCTVADPRDFCLKIGFVGFLQSNLIGGWKYECQAILKVLDSRVTDLIAYLERMDLYTRAIQHRPKGPCLSIAVLLRFEHGFCPCWHPANCESTEVILKNYWEGCTAPALLVLNLAQRQEGYFPKSAMSNFAREL